MVTLYAAIMRMQRVLHSKGKNPEMPPKLCHIFSYGVCVDVKLNSNLEDENDSDTLCMHE